MRLVKRSISATAETLLNQNPAGLKKSGSEGLTTVRSIEVRKLGLVSYEATHALQEELQQQRIRGEIPDTLLLLEHTPVITMGRAAKAENVLFSREALAERGVDYAEIGRGGDATYHGPGQLVAYPIFDLKPDRQDVRKYVWSIEEAMIRTVARWKIDANRVQGFNGTWVSGSLDSATSPTDRKIGAVGVRISRWVTMHGLALNVSTKLEDFDLIIPCGIRDKGVTSMTRELGREIAVDEVADALTAELAALHDAEVDR